jgi:hypothetical protein
MKLDSIVFNCPIFFGGNIHVNHQHQMSAPSLENYLCTNDVFRVNSNSNKHYNKVLLMTVEIDGALSVLQKSRKLKRLLKISDKLSAYLDAIIVVVELTRDDDSNDLELKTIHVAGDDVSDDNSEDSSDEDDE